MKKVENALTQGLMEGYAGKEVKPIIRAGFQGKASHVELPNGDVYHDEWFTPNFSGGGQELIRIGEEQFTRLYAGGTPEPAVLETMGLTPKDVSRYLKRKITELGDKTRLFEDCSPEPDDEWQYGYKVTGNDQATKVTTGMESITYQGATVHIHAFILCPLR